MATRRQHYVWQKYLEPWTTKSGKAQQLWCLRRDATAPIQVSTKNVAVERDFYRLLELQPGDADFVRWVAFGPKTNRKLQELNEGWLSGLEALLGLQRVARACAQGKPDLLALLDEQMIQFEEDAYARLEGDAVSNLAALQLGDVSFFDVEQQAVSFSYFLAQQYFRTKAIRNRIRDTFPAQTDKDRFNRTWPLFRYVFATNVGYSIFAHRHSIKLQVLQAAPDMEFITADQPVINTYGAFVSPATPLEELELFYPVSPTRAVILSGHPTYKGAHGMTLEPFRMDYLNQTIEHVAYEQLFAKSENALRSLVPQFCRSAL